MPLQMRLPKYGFSSRVGRITAEVRTSELNKIDADIIDVAALRKANLITAGIKRVKVMLSGDINKAVTLQGIRVTKGARAAIEAAGGKVIEAEAAPAKGKLVKKAERAESASEPKPVAEEKPVAEKKPAAEAPAADEAADETSAKDD
jgi:large subunit ribosomal protein L15